MYNSIILSAGKGTRMKSSSPKVLQEILGKPMVSLVLDELIKAGVNNNFLTVGYKKEDVISTLDKEYDSLKYGVQEEQLGTGHAVMQMSELMMNLDGTTIITCGDTPLLTAKIFKNLINFHTKNSSDLTILSALVDNPYGYGRIIRDENNKVLKIVEQKDATDIEAQTKEINSGIYCIDNKLLFKHINELNNNNAQKEYYLTDIIQKFKENDYMVDAFVIEDDVALMGVNDHINLAKATKVLQQRINEKHLENGVKIIDPQNTYIAKDVEIGEGTVIYPNNYIVGKTTIGKNNILKTSNHIEDTTIGDNNQIGPMAFLRNSTTIGSQTRVGNFVEMKNTKFASGAKSAHLTYLGDSEVGEKTNIGCGVITANYDGKNKHKTKIGNNAFIGSNVNLVAPVEVGDGVFVAAGTTVTQSIEEEKFVIGRVKQQVKNKK